MADTRILPDAALAPTASPVDRFAVPVRQSTSGIDQLAESLARVNPKLQGIINTQQKRRIESEEAKGIVAAGTMDPSLGLADNKAGWGGLLESVRKQDAQRGTNNADALLGASPHFKRGMVKAKAQRLGLGLQSHLQMQWQNDVGGIKSADDPKVVQDWVQAQTLAYSEAAGIGNIDPLIVAEVFENRVATAQESLFSGHMSYRAQKRVGEFGEEFAANIGLLASGAGNGASSVDDFMARMTQSESGGRSSVINSEGYGGWMQFGQDRLDDYNRAYGTNITVREFVKNEALQAKVGRWHINAIDKEIAASGYLDLGYSLDGLRAVRHLGGWGGVEKFVASGGKSKIADSNGTSLTDYYRKFAGPSSQMQVLADEAVSNGVDKKVVNKNLVDTIIAEALATGNPAILDNIDGLDTGNGPLANIAWVKAARVRAEEQISDNQWEDESRKVTLENRDRAANTRRMTAEGYQAILKAPFGDITSLLDEANGAGEAELARSLYNWQQQLQKDEKSFDTDTTGLALLRLEIFKGMPADEASLAIAEGVLSQRWTNSEAETLFDELSVADANKDVLQDPNVRKWVTNMRGEIIEDLTVRDFFGELITSGKEIANRFEEEWTDEMIIFKEDNPDASMARFRKEARSIARRLRGQADYQRPKDAGLNQPTQLDGETAPTPAGQPEAPSSQPPIQKRGDRRGSQNTPEVADPFEGKSDAEIAAAAQARGVDVETFKQKVYAATGFNPEGAAGR